MNDSVRKAFLKLQIARQKEADARSLLLLLLDAEKECPAELAPRLLQAARQARSDAGIDCVLAKQMLENWFVAGATTLAGVNGLPGLLKPPPDPEDRNGKAWLKD